MVEENAARKRTITNPNRGNTMKTKTRVKAGGIVTDPLS